MILKPECCFFSSSPPVFLHIWWFERACHFVMLRFLCILTGTKACTMRCYVTAAIIVCIFLIVSCGENEGGGRLESARTASTPALSAPATPAINPAVTPINNPSAPVIAAGKVNPPHGQPGHRCDIAVGAPLPATNAPVLNTNPANAPVINTPAPAIVTQPQPQAQPVATPSNGLNPPHGQPGHRCDIAVGQPLSKAPAKNATTTPAVVSTAASKPLVEAPDTLFAKGLNPAHGKPGHRCDIAVGQPLAGASKKDTAKTN